jgi:mannan endo-1,4-beta-mannosidase
MVDEQQVAQIIPMHPSNCAACGQRVIDLNKAIVPWAESKNTSTSPITVVDCWTGFDADKDTVDGVHPNSATGIQKLANSWYAPLAAVLQKS